MSSGLSSLVKNLEKQDLKLLKRYFPKQSDLLSRKGVYPYDYMDSFEKLIKSSLPEKSEFYSKVNDEHISDEEYTYAQNIWEAFNMKTLKDYHDLYLKTDVILLADVFEKFRKTCLENYDLDPLWYYTSPGLAWDAALKTTGVRLELLSKENMYLMIEKGIRGGVSMITKRHIKANNKYIQDLYDPQKPNIYIPYLDANNLYGWAMMKKLPTHDFKWMNNTELDSWEKWLLEPAKRDLCETRGSILEVDLDYPIELHNLHNDFPLAPEKMISCLEEGIKVEKLIPNLYHKKNYVVHHEILKDYLKKGLILRKIHKGIRFEESAWLRPYIKKNTNLRTLARNKFEKDFFKLMNNSVFGKTMENVRKRVVVKLVDNNKRLKKLIKKPEYKSFTVFDENLIAIHSYKTKLVLNKPIYVGMSILYIPKSLMYDFHYNYIKNKYGSKAKFRFTDTDSLLYEIETEDFYKDISPDLEKYFDTCEIIKDNPHITKGLNKKVPGLFKHECRRTQIMEFIGLRAKLYAYKKEEEEVRKCKGLKKAVIQTNLKLEHYRKCLHSGLPVMRKMSIIRSRKHQVYSETVNKIALSADDDKRLILEDKTNTLAYGHYKAKIL